MDKCGIYTCTCMWVLIFLCNITIYVILTRHDYRNKKTSEQYTGHLFLKRKDIPVTVYPFSLGRHIIKQCQYGKTHKRGQSKTKVYIFFNLCIKMGIYFHLYTCGLLYERDFIFKQVDIHVLIYSIDYIDFELLYS